MKHGAEITAPCQSMRSEISPQDCSQKHDWDNDLLICLFASSVKLSPVKMAGCAWTMILFSWFDHLAECFSYKEVQF